jgi:hypothetical protein
MRREIKKKYDIEELDDVSKKNGYVLIVTYLVVVRLLHLAEVHVAKLMLTYTRFV